MTIQGAFIVAVVIIILQLAMFRRYALQDIRYERYFDVTTCFAGDEVHLVEVIGNHKLLPVPWLRMESVMPSQLRFQGNVEMAVNSGSKMQNHMSLFSLMSRTEVTRRHTVRSAQRGYFKLNSVTMTSGDLFGIGIESVQLHPDCRIIVYPKPLPLNEIPLPYSSWLGEVLVKRWIVEDPFMTIGVREYQTGDPLNSIHWKATARTGALHVYKRGHTADRKLMIYLNIEDGEGMWQHVNKQEMIEQGIVYAASVADHAIRAGMPTGFRSNGRLVDGQLRMPVDVPCFTGSSHMTLLLEAMAKLELRRSIPMADLLETAIQQGERNMDCLLITAFVDDKLEQAIVGLKRLGNTVEVMLMTETESPAEESEVTAYGSSQAG